VLWAAPAPGGKAERGLFRAWFSQRFQAIKPSDLQARAQAATYNRTVLTLADDSRNADVGARYAQALFELAEQAGALQAVEADLKGLKALRAESEDLRRLLVSPTFTAEDKGKGLAAIADAAGVSPLTKKFVGLLAANARASALPAVITAFERLAAERRGAVAAEVTSALPLSKTQLKNIATALTQALGKDPELTARVDPSILGGLRVRVGSRLFDASLKSRLDSLKFALKRA
jgi:F-type H+-transporting ATPase subunit delta